MILRIMVVSVLLTGSLVAQQPSAFWSAIVRDDGLLVVIALFDGTRWTPTPKFGFDLPRELQDEWFFWPTKGSPRTIKAGIPVLFERFAQEPGVAFVTDHCASTAIVNVHPYPKAGVAFQGKVSFQRMVSANTSDNSIKQLLATLAKAFYDRESSAFADTKSTMSFFGTPPSIETRKKITMKVQSLYRSEDRAGTKQTYYFELLRHYPYPSGNCSSVSMFSGWAAGPPNQLAYFGEGLSLGDCDGKGLSRTLEPFGFIDLQGRRFFVVDIAPYEGERATILERRENRLIDVLPADE